LPTSAPPDAEPASPAEPDARTDNGELILLVEDEALVRIATKASLQALGYQVITAGHGYEALDHLEANPDIALIITDIAMPGMDGQDLADAARLLRPDIAVLLTTGYERAKHGAEAYPVLTKPYLLDQLAAMIARLLKAGRRSEQAKAKAKGISPHHGATGKEPVRDGT